MNLVCSSLADYSYYELENYFSTGFEKPVCYYNACATIYFHGKLKGIWPGNEVFLKKYNEIPLFIVNSSMFLYCPKTEASAFKAATELRKHTSQPIWIVAPPFIPSHPAFRKQLARKQLIYDCAQITEDLNESIRSKKSSLLHTRSIQMFRKNSKECFSRDIEPADDRQILKVLEQWRTFRKDRQLVNLQKDREVLLTVFQDKNFPVIATIGFRGDKPASVSLIAKIPGSPDYGAQIISKSLNYKMQEGGYNETSVWQLYQSCIRCLQEGILFINASGYDSKELSLGQFKLRFSRPDLNFEVFDFVF